MRHKLILVFLYLTFSYGNSQQFSLDRLQSNERIEVALDSAYLWLETNNFKDFITNYMAIDKAIDLSANKEFRARFDSFKAGFYYLLFDFEKFNNLSNKAFDYYKKSDNNEMLIYLYNLKGLYEFNNNGNTEKAILWYEKAIELVENKDEETEQMFIDFYFNLAVFYSEIENWEASYFAANTSIELAKKYNIESRLRRMYYNKGIALFHLNDIKGAIDNFKLSENIVKKAEAATGEKVYYKEAEYLYGFSEVYNVQGEYKKSADYLKQYYERMNEKFYPTIRKIGVKIKKNSNLLVEVAKEKEAKAQDKLKKTKFIYLTLLSGLALLIIMGLLIFIFQQRKHQKINIKKKNILLSKNREVENALKVKTDFLNSITHELRTPLYAINAITHMMKQNGTKNIDLTQVDILSFSGDHLLRFINDVIDFNKGDSSFDFKNLNFESQNLNTLLFNIKKTITYSLQTNNENNYVFDVDNNILNCLEVDALKLTRIIINLLNNASKNTKNGNISLLVKQLDSNSETSTIEFCVKDTGRGISKIQLDEIYQAFNNNLDLVKRIDNKASGLGLGLVMVNRLLQLYNSQLSIKTEEGVGTEMTFVIKFKVSKTNVLHQKLDLHTIKTKKTGIHMLIVDDNKVNQFVTSKLVKEEGFTCDIVSGGFEAVELFVKNNNYDIILMDIMMPGMDGFEATKRIKTLCPEQKIIALTAMSIGENKQKFIDSGFENVLEKPFIINKFNTVIHTLIA